MNPAYIEALAKALAPIIKTVVASEVAAVREDSAALKQECESLRKQLEAAPVPKDGKDGRDCDMEAVRALISEAVKEIPTPEAGLAGADGKDGASVTLEDIQPILADAVRGMQEEAAQKIEAAIKSLPTPKDGRDGVDGKDGAQGEKGADGAGIADLVTDRDGALVATFTDGRMKTLGVIVGKDGAPGKDGRDGLGFDDLQVEYDGQKTITLKMQKGDVTKEANIVMPINIDRGIFKEGQTYTAGDSVTWGGSYWIAQRDTSAKPDSADSGWRLAVKRGRDGKDGRDGIDKTAPVSLKD